MIPIFTVTKNRPDLICLWNKALSSTLITPHSTIVVHDDSIRVECGDHLVSASSVGLNLSPNAARPAYDMTLRIIPQEGIRVFLEEDIIPIRPWSLDQYEGNLIYLEGRPNQAWRGLMIARDGKVGSVLYQPFRAIKQQYFRDAGCPDWIPQELCEPCLKANAKIAGDHFIHIDKVRQHTSDHEAKEELIQILSEWFNNRSFDKNIELLPASNITEIIDLKNLKNLHQPSKPIGGPGTELKKLLNKIGIKAEPGCSCNSRAGIMDSNEYREPGWCEKNIETIVGWLREEAEKRNLLFINSLTKLLVRKAIRNSKK